MHKKILLDASSAILLAKIGFHETVAKEYSVMMPEYVFNEITGNRLPGSSEYEKLLQENLLTILPVPETPTSTAVQTSLHKLDTGEREILLLFFAGHGDYVVTDDGAAAKYCLNNNIPFVNSLLILRVLHHSGIVEESTYRAGFNSLLFIGRYSENIINFAQNCSDKELLFFLPED